MVRTDDLRKMLSELVRVAAPGGTVVWWLPTSSSFGEFFSIFWEALLNAELEDFGVAVEHLITDLPSVSDIKHMAEAEGLGKVQTWTAIEEFDFESGEQFLSAPLITDFLLQRWLGSIPEAAHERVMQELGHIIDEERHSGEFVLTMKATLLIGTKQRVQ
jgi:hypothetical protein